ncbi:MAG: RIP metalloprotease RseP [Candidatus Magasanikbacteria bacterium]
MIILATVLGLSLLVLIHEFGHFSAAKIFDLKVEEFGFGFPPKLFSKKWGETEYSFNLFPLGGFVKIYGEDKMEVDDMEEPERSLVFQPTWKKSIIMLAGIVMNIVLGWLAISLVFMSGIPQHLAVAKVSPESPAKKAGLRVGDIITKVEGPQETLKDPISAEAFINNIDQNPTAQYVLTIKRGDETVTRKITGRSDPPKGKGNLGIALTNMGVPQKSFLQSFVSGARSTVRTLYAIFSAFVGLIKSVFSTPQTAIQGLTGPVGIFVLAKEAGELGIAYLTQLIALISLNLAVLNLIPFPALDGGRLVMAWIEKIKGSPISRKVQASINLIGFALLIILLIFITFRDITKFF